MYCLCVSHRALRGDEHHRELFARPAAGSRALLEGRVDLASGGELFSVGFWEGRTSPLAHCPRLPAGSEDAGRRIKWKWKFQPTGQTCSKEKCYNSPCPGDISH